MTLTDLGLVIRMSPHDAPCKYEQNRSVFYRIKSNLYCVDQPECAKFIPDKDVCVICSKYLETLLYLSVRNTATVQFVGVQYTSSADDIYNIRKISSPS